MIEIEIRGKLDKEKYIELGNFLSSNGEFIGEQDREMVLVFDTPGYSHDPTERKVDIRLRQTNGETEIMIKEIKSENNVARYENQFILKDKNLEDIKKMVKFLGFNNGQWMHRKKKAYTYLGVHWSLVEAVPGIYYFEIEKEVSDDSEIDSTQSELNQIAKDLNLEILSKEEYKKFIELLSEKVNKYISW